MFGAVSSGRIVRNILEYLGVQGQETLAPAEYLGGQGQESETRAPTTTTRTADDKGHGPPKVSYKVSKPEPRIITHSFIGTGIARA